MPSASGLQAQPVGQRDHGGDQHVGAVVVGQVEDERAVDLEGGDRHLMQPAERRVAGAEVVDREPQAALVQLGDDRLARPGDSCIAADSVSSTIIRSGESPNDSIVSSTLRIAVGCQNTGGRLTDTYRSSPMSRQAAPCRQASLDHPLRDRRDHAGALGQRDERRRA